VGSRPEETEGEEIPSPGLPRGHRDEEDATTPSPFRTRRLRRGVGKSTRVF
ncbi:hypothetical protein NHX12_000034, partial [Muraenolepis orangiensis]